MGLKDLARQLSGDESATKAAASEEPNDAFDAPMMIMNQIHEA